MRFFVDLPIRHRRCTVVQIQSDLPNARMVEWAPGFIPFTRASSADLSGKRATGCLRGRSPRVLWLPDKSSNAANPQGRVVGCPGGLLRGAGQAAPLGSPGRRNQDDKPTQIIINAAEVPQHGLTGRPSSNSATALHGGSSVERELDLPGWGDRIQPSSAPQIRTEIHITRRQNRLHPVMHIQLAQNRRHVGFHRGFGDV